jgi:hypothetical protein
MTGGVAWMDHFAIVNPQAIYLNRFSSRESATTNCERPVISSTCSVVVTESIRSLKWMVPLNSVRIENVYGSHSSRIAFCFTGAPSS